MCKRSALLTVALLGLLGSAWAQSGAATMSNQLSAANSTGLSRAQVLGDLAAWHRAGMSHWPMPPSEIDVEFTAEYKAALTRYQQARNQPVRASTESQQTVAGYQDVPGK